MRGRTGYSAAQIALHWAVVVLIAVQLTVSDGMEQGFDDRMNGSQGAGGWAVLHITLGLGVVSLAALRLGLRLTRGAPPPAAGNPALVKWSGMLTHLALYLVMFAMPLTGALAWFGYSEVAAELHEAGRFILIVLIGLHVLGALAEHFVFGHNTLWRMFHTEATLPKTATLPKRKS